MTHNLLKLSLLAAAATLSVAATPAFAQNEAAVPAVSEAAQRFGTLYVPLEFSLKTALMGFDAQFKPAISADPNVVALDQKFPGLIDAAGSAGRAAMEKVMRRELPATQQRVAALAAARFTGTDLAGINAFLASPSGQRLQQVMAENADPSAMTKEMRQTGQLPQLNGEKLLAMIDPAVITKLSKEELADLIKFSASPAGRKFDTAGTAFVDLVATEMNGIIAAMKPDIEQAVVTAITAHLGRK